MQKILAPPNDYFHRPDFRRYSKFLADWITLSKLIGLEIGPLDKPLLPKPLYNIKYLDVFPVEKLVKSCSKNPNRDENLVVALDYVTGSRNISEVVDQKFDYVVASHVIEHLPNMFGWLRDLAKILNTNGKLFLIVPDRRFTFDMMRPLSSLGELIENDHNQLRKPTFRSVFDQRFYHRNALPHQIWHAMSESLELDLEPTFSSKNALEFAQLVDMEYIDVHCNVFEPDQFVEIINESFDLGLHPFKCTKIEPTTPSFLDFIALLQIKTAR